MIELSNHVAVKYDREKFTAKVLRNTYSAKPQRVTNHSNAMLAVRIG